MISTWRSFAPPAFLLVVSVFLFTGCTDAYRMKVADEAWPKPGASVSYVVRDAGRYIFRDAGLDDIPDIDPAAAAKDVKTALSTKGMFEAPEADKADMVVTYSYKIEQRRRFSQWDEAFYQRQQVSNYQPERVMAGTDAGGNPVYATVVDTNPTIDPGVGMIHHSIDEIVYVKELHLVATERKPTMPGTPPRVWDISIGYEDEDPSMDKSMPLLAGAGCDLIGTNTNGPVVVRLHDKDEVVAFIKRGK